MKIFRPSRAETLIEVLIALSMFMLITAPASALIAASANLTAGNRLSLTAEGLAEEGIELMLAVRGGNILRFAPKEAECWNTKPEYTDANCDKADNKIINLTEVNPLYFTIAINPASTGLAISLVSQSSGLNRTNGSIDLAGNGDSAFQIGTSGIYREIAIKNVAGFSGEALKIISTVAYRAGGKVRTIVREQILTRPI